MLIKVFGIWLMATNITYLETTLGSCYVNFNGRVNYVVFKQSCEGVAAEINRQIKLVEGK